MLPEVSVTRSLMQDSGETGAQGRSNKETGTKKDNSKEETENVESSAQSEQPGIHTITHQHCRLIT